MRKDARKTIARSKVSKGFGGVGQQSSRLSDAIVEFGYVSSKHRYLSIYPFINTHSNLRSDSPNVTFSPEPPTHSRSPYSIPQSFSPSSMTGASTTGPAFSTLSSMSTNFSNTLPMAATSSSSSGLQLTPTLTDSQVTRLTLVAERYIFLKLIKKESQ